MNARQKRTRTKRTLKSATTPNIASLVPTIGQRLERAIHVIELVRCGLNDRDAYDDRMFSDYARDVLAEAGDGLFFLHELLQQQGIAKRPAPTPDEQKAIDAVAALAGGR